jgi:hypothetical protein
MDKPRIYVLGFFYCFYLRDLFLLILFEVFIVRFLDVIFYLDDLFLYFPLLKYAWMGVQKPLNQYVKKKNKKGFKIFGKGLK